MMGICDLARGLCTQMVRQVLEKWLCFLMIVTRQLILSLIYHSLRQLLSTISLEEESYNFLSSGLQAVSLLHLRPCSSVLSKNNGNTVSLKQCSLNKSIFTASDDIHSLLQAFPLALLFPEPEEDTASLATLLESLLWQQADLHALFLWEVPLNVLFCGFVLLPWADQVVEMEMGSLVVTPLPVIFQACPGHYSVAFLCTLPPTTKQPHRRLQHSTTGSNLPPKSVPLNRNFVNSSSQLFLMCTSWSEIGGQVEGQGGQEVGGLCWGPGVIPVSVKCQQFISFCCLLICVNTILFCNHFCKQSFHFINRRDACTQVMEFSNFLY